MYLYVTLVVLPVITNYIRCDSTTEIQKDMQAAQQKDILKTSFKELLSTTDSPFKPTVTSRTSHSTSDVERQRSSLENSYPRYMLSQAHLTKLAKTLSLNFDPSFSKDYFEPFERRPRPVTLVAFRKNGFDPKHVLKYESGGRLNSLEVAELQSPYNDVGAFWQELPGGGLN